MRNNVFSSHFGSSTCRLVLPPSSWPCNRLRSTMAATDYMQWWPAEWTLQNPPTDLKPLTDYYEWDLRGGWRCKKCNQPATRGHTDGRKHQNMAWAENQHQGAVRAGYAAAGEPTAGGGGVSIMDAAAGYAAAVEPTAGGGGGESSCPASPAIAAVVIQQLDRIEAAVARLVAELEQVKEQLNMIQWHVEYQ